MDPSPPAFDELERPAEIPPDQLRRVLVEQLASGLPSLLGWIALIYGLLAVANPLYATFLPAPSSVTEREVSYLQDVIFGLNLAGWLAWRKHPPTRGINAIAFLLGALPLADSLLHTAAWRDPVETLSFVIVMLASAMVFTSRRWFACFIAMAFISWGLTATAVLSHLMVLDLLFVLGQASLLACAIFAIRYRTLVRLESLRWVAEWRGLRLDRQNKRLHELDRLKSAFVNAASHDLRSPLTAIRGYAEFLQEDLTLTQTTQGYVEQILRANGRLERLAEDLLDVARLEAGLFKLRPEVDDFTLRAGELVESMEPFYRTAGVELRFEHPNHPLMAYFDAQRIGQVIGNFLSNAGKFTPPGGHVVLRVMASGPGVRCEVKDTGPGITEADQPLLFRRFSQLRTGREKGGTGLGLSIAKSIIEAHGGQVGLTSAPGAGSTFWFELPAADAVRRAVAAAEAGEAGPVATG